MPLVPALGRQRQSLVYRVSSRTARAIQRNPVSKNQKKKKERKKESLRRAVPGQSCLIASNGTLELGAGHQMKGKVCGAEHREGSSRKAWRSDRYLLSAPREHLNQQCLETVWAIIVGTRCH